MSFNVSCFFALKLAALLVLYGRPAIGAALAALTTGKLLN
jgi:hypothetical protein